MEEINRKKPNLVSPCDRGGEVAAAKVVGHKICQFLCSAIHTQTPTTLIAFVSSDCVFRKFRIAV